MVDAFGISGCHRMNGVMIARGEAIKPASRLEGARIYDMAPTLLYLMNQDVPDDMDGRVFHEAIEHTHLDANPVRRSTQRESEQSHEMEFSPDENADVIERLKSLGYIA